MRSEVRQHGELAELAARQHGVVSRAQLATLGYSDGSVSRALRASRLHRVYRGAFAVGHPNVGPRGRCMAGVLSCGEGALVSHHAAAWLWRLLPRPPHHPDVTCPSRGHRRPGPRIHHSTILEAEDRAEVDGIPVTAVARTLLDIAGRRRRTVLNSAIDRAERMDVLDLYLVDELLARAGGHPGRRPLRLATEIYRAPEFDRARSELLFLDLTAKAGLPRPTLNLFVAGHEIDAYWERERFAVEVDGWGTHRTRAAFERDPLRIEDLKLAGIDAIRLTVRRIERHPKEVADRLRRHLTRRRHELGLA